MEGEETQTMKRMQWKQAQLCDLEEILEIIEDAKHFHRKNNINQWVGERPSSEDLQNDILHDRFFILQDCDNHRIIACAALIIGEDPTYQSIYEGHWNTCPNGEPYATIHRFAVAKEYTGKGCSKVFMEKIFHYLKQLRVCNVRIDTHKDNLLMQKLIAQSGFSYCGIIHIADGSERIAFDKHL